MQKDVESCELDVNKFLALSLVLVLIYEEVQNCKSIIFRDEKLRIFVAKVVCEHASQGVEKFTMRYCE